MDLSAVRKQIVEGIDAYCLQAFDDELRKHLGASVIGKPCARQAWYSFRWTFKENHTPRMRRLFNRGHREEERFIAYLRGAGWTVWEADPHTGKQFRISDWNGHFGGSLDGIAWHPDFGYFLAEFKTHNAKSFAKLKTEGVRKAKPEHFVQMSTYGAYRRLQYAIYMAVNKDDDDLHIEVVELDERLAKEIMNKAGDIITTQIPPKKLNNSETYFDCKYCAAKGICHGSDPYLKNCRSCEFASPHDNKTWLCAKFGIIPEEVIPKGCGYHKEIGR